MVDMPPTVNLNFFASYVFGTPAFPLSKIPMQEIIHNAENGKYKIKPAEVFDFTDLPKAHELMESNKANGKIVVRL